jgi:hypothetical protein
MEGEREKVAIDNRLYRLDGLRHSGVLQCSLAFSIRFIGQILLSQFRDNSTLVVGNERNSCDAIFADFFS